MVPPDSGRVSRVRPYSGTPSGGPSSFVYGAVTRYGAAFQLLRLGATLLTPAGAPGTGQGPHNTACTTPWGLHARRFGLCPVRSPLLRTSMSLSFPGVTKMFQFTPLASVEYAFVDGSRGIDPRSVPAFGDPR